MWSMLGMVSGSLLSKKRNSLVAVFSVTLMLLSKYSYMPFSHKVVYHSYYIFMDKVSSMLMLLTVWMTLLMVLSMVKANKVGYLYFKFKALNLMLMCSFLVDKYLAFFMFFELSLIPTLMMMMGWGMQPERMRAGSYLMMYTVIGAVPLLLSIVFSYYSWGGLGMSSIFTGKDLRSKDEYSWLLVFWILGFLMKLPIYGVHLWLPKAHVEAPVAGSMVLAGVLLKLGAYGLMRMSSFLDFFSFKWSSSLFVWLLYSMCMVGFICFRQADLKSLVAYSSVAHMSLVMLGFFSMDLMGLMGVVGMLVAHGMCSSGLFFSVQCFYELSGSRSIILNRGVLSLSPVLCFFWLLLCVGNASAPPSLNLVSEFLLISSMLNFSNFGAVFCFLSVFLAGLFSMYLYVLTCHGKWSVSNNYWNNLSGRHYMVLLLHSMPIYLLVFLGNILFPGV